MPSETAVPLSQDRRPVFQKPVWDTPSDWSAMGVSSPHLRFDRTRFDDRWSASAADTHALTHGHELAKRFFDASAAMTALVLLLPLLCLVALAIKLADRGPVLYRHRRVGRSGAAFDCLKFRTMVTDADGVLRRHLAADPAAAREWAEKRKLTKDPRITPLGAVLRKTSLDELPQLLNIIKGEMSLVGPRPIVWAEMSKYGSCIVHYLRVRPGLTGAWQVSGRNDVDYARRVELDREYVENWTFRCDLLIILRTVRVIVTTRGCY